MRAWVWLLCGALVAGSAALAFTGNDRGAGPPLAATVMRTPTATPTPADPREAEYATLTQLRAGINIAKFEEALGSAYFIRGSKDGAFIEKTFRGPGRSDPGARPDYWVQAVQDSLGTVQLMAVTSCAPDFNPEFNGPAGNYTLNKSTFASAPDRMPTELRYLTSGATANSYYYDHYYFGNPGYYKDFFVGIDDACPEQLDDASLKVIFDTVKFGKPIPFKDATDPAFKAFREKSIVNTYAETAPLARLADILAAFQIGADRILVRTAPFRD